MPQRAIPHSGGYLLLNPPPVFLAPAGAQGVLLCLTIRLVQTYSELLRVSDFLELTKHTGNHYDDQDYRRSSLHQRASSPESDLIREQVYPREQANQRAYTLSRAVRASILCLAPLKLSV